ncbi:hypothetical protein OC846_004354 [Tilletia horrida]|uniref:Major facilitator superfamily (MFS) profile domain-containing protein n=1 Tax=Tilletia horrida TaxID=155126 RepID=A0AAN6JQG9_9BASI|nr:hypothetical protein OC845_004406 [Tilletia horrida]KAK0548780.1 hypothetical protein OC846_004354 [Tilletia horrida]KAK0568047.1 hypothetical protein OC861_002363 [Tilletia horrida]
MATEQERVASYGSHLERTQSQFTDEKGLQTPDTQSVVSAEKQPGVAAAQAAWTLPPWMLALTWIGIGLTAYAYGLDNNVTYATIQQSTMVFKQFSWYPTLQVIQQVMIAVVKFPIAKLADVFGRAQGYVLSVFFYIIGFIILASSENVKTTAAGCVFYAIGNTGVQIMQQIVIADWTPARWRGAAIGLVSLPYVVNFAVAPRIVKRLVNTEDLSSDSWRWLAGIFPIIFPIVTAPVIFTLALNQTRARQQGLVPRHPYFQMGFRQAVWAFCVDIDLFGLLLICAGFLLLLIPIKLQANTPNGWGEGSIIAMLTVGGACIAALTPYEYFLAPKPILKQRFVLQKDVVFPALIGFFDFVSFYLSWTSAYTWVYLSHGWTLDDASYFSNTQSLCLTVFGIAAGFVSAATRRFKWQMVVGAVIRLVGLGLMIRYRSLQATNVQLVFPQVLQGLGGGILGVILQVSAQVAVPHQDVAMVTAFVLLAAELGGAVGSAIVSAVQVDYFPQRVDFYLPNLDSTVRNTLVESPFAAAAYPLGSEIRTGVSQAYTDFIHRLLIVAIVIAALPIILSTLLTDRKLTDTQNCVNTKEKAVAHEAVQIARGEQPLSRESDVEKRA